MVLNTWLWKWGEGWYSTINDDVWPRMINLRVNGRNPLQNGETSKKAAYISIEEQSYMRNKDSTHMMLE